MNVLLREDFRKERVEEFFGCDEDIVGSVHVDREIAVGVLYLFDPGGGADFKLGDLADLYLHRVRDCPSVFVDADEEGVVRETGEDRLFGDEVLEDLIVDLRDERGHEEVNVLPDDLLVGEERHDVLEVLGDLHDLPDRVEETDEDDAGVVGVFVEFAVRDSSLIIHDDLVEFKRYFMGIAECFLEVLAEGEHFGRGGVEGQESLDGGEEEGFLQLHL